MNARQFFDKVALMRKLQKEYFRTRSKTALNQSKAVEREVDADEDCITVCRGVKQGLIMVILFTFNEFYNIS